MTITSTTHTNTTPTRQRQRTLKSNNETNYLIKVHFTEGRKAGVPISLRKTKQYGIRQHSTTTDDNNNSFEEMIAIMGIHKIETDIPKQQYPSRATTAERRLLYTMPMPSAKVHDIPVEATLEMLEKSPMNERMDQVIAWPQMKLYLEVIDGELMTGQLKKKVGASAISMNSTTKGPNMVRKPVPEGVITPPQRLTGTMSNPSMTFEPHDVSAKGQMLSVFQRS